MKFALLIDKILHDSFSVVDGKSYKMKTGEPYNFHSSIGNHTAFGITSWPFIFNGDFIKMMEWEELPKNDYDVIIIVVERFFDEYPIEKIRKVYPNTIILATMKEDAHLIRYYQKLVDFYNTCDGLILPFYDAPYEQFTTIKTDVAVPIYSIAQPYDIDYLYKKFYREERKELIFSYVAPNPIRRSNTEDFANYLGNKYNIPVTRKYIEYYQGRNQWHDFLDIFTPSTFNINCDPGWHQGHQGIQAAMFGIINIGGRNDSHRLLWPKTAIQDLTILEERFYNYITNMDERVKIIQYAWDKLWKYYSFKSAKEKIHMIMEKLK